MYLGNRGGMGIRGSIDQKLRTSEPGTKFIGSTIKFVRHIFIKLFL